MSRREFDSFLVHTKIGSSRKLGRVPASHRWVWVAGVLALAAESPIRGSLLIQVGEPAADKYDIARMAGVPVATAAKALEAFKRLGMLDWDSELECLRVRNWDRYQPQPPSEARDRARERKRRQRHREALKRAREAAG